MTQTAKYDQTQQEVKSIATSVVQQHSEVPSLAAAGGIMLVAMQILEMIRDKRGRSGVARAACFNLAQKLIQIVDSRAQADEQPDPDQLAIEGKSAGDQFPAEEELLPVRDDLIAKLDQKFNGKMTYEDVAACLSGMISVYLDLLDHSYTDEEKLQYVLTAYVAFAEFVEEPDRTKLLRLAADITVRDREPEQ